MCCAPYHISSNGAVERLVEMVKQAVKSGSYGGVPLEQTLPAFLKQIVQLPCYHWNISKHRTSGLSYMYQTIPSQTKHCWSCASETNGSAGLSQPTMLTMKTPLCKHGFCTHHERRPHVGSQSCKVSDWNIDLPCRGVERITVEETFHNRGSVDPDLSTRIL